ncbi:hypothetical protein Trydic_g4619 [Trypoxylus dichotomus]
MRQIATPLTKSVHSNSPNRPTESHLQESHSRLSQHSIFYLSRYYDIRLDVVWSGGLDLQGPFFLQEPPHRVEFSNSSGGKVDCSAHGSPPPDVEWVLSDGSTVRQIPDLRILLPNGSLYFPPFSSERYRHDVHSTVYKCRLQSSLGVVLSRDVHVKAGNGNEVHACKSCYGVYSTASCSNAFRYPNHWDQDDLVDKLAQRVYYLLYPIKR